MTDRMNFTFFISLFLLTSCAPTPITSTLSPNLEHIPSLIEVPKDVCVAAGISGFKIPLYILDAQNNVLDINNRNLEVAIEDASEKLFERIFQNTFRHVTWNSNSFASSNSTPCESIFQINIKDLKVRLSKSIASTQVCWANITYQVDLFDHKKARITNWTVTGNGESISGDFSEDIANCVNKSICKAIEAAGIEFMTSFYDIPEAVRWLNAKQIDQATIKTFKQNTEPHDNRYETKVLVHHDSVFTLVTPKTITSPLAIPVIFKNEGKHTFLLNPSHITLKLPGESLLKAAPVLSFAASLTKYQLWGIGVLYPSFGPLSSAYGVPLVGSVIDLFITLNNLAITQKESSELMRNFLELGKMKMKKTFLKENEKLEEYLFFLLEGDPSNYKKLILSIPVVDVNESERFIINIPLNTSGG